VLDENFHFFIFYCTLGTTGRESRHVRLDKAWQTSVQMLLCACHILTPNRYPVYGLALRATLSFYLPFPSRVGLAGPFLFMGFGLRAAFLGVDAG
jgi:hypothetical protein